MSNRIALVLILIVVGALALDAALNGAQAGLFLARKLAELIEYLAFWR